MRDSFVFYRSFIQAIEMLDKQDQLNSLLGIIHYALDGVEPKVEGMPQVVYTLVKPVIDGNNQKYLNGKKGGRPKKEENHGLSERETGGFKNDKPYVDEDEDEDLKEDVVEDVKENVEDPDNSLHITLYSASQKGDKENGN